MTAITPSSSERALPPEVIAFDDFLNEPDSGETSASPVREFRHRAYKKWNAALTALLKDRASLGAAQVPAPIDEKQKLRDEQSLAVMPQIGPLLDAWEGMNNDTKGIVQEESPGFAKRMASINCAMEGVALLPKSAGAAQVPSLDAKDAARYRWLRDVSEPNRKGEAPWCTVRDSKGYAWATMSMLDAAIDEQISNAIKAGDPDAALSPSTEAVPKGQS